MRFFVMLAAIATPMLASAGEVDVSAKPVENFQTLAPTLTTTEDGVLVEGGYCRQARYAARPVNVRIVKVDAAGAEGASKTVRLLGATGNRSKGCGYYAARANWALSNGDKIEIRPNTN